MSPTPISAPDRLMARIATFSQALRDSGVEVAANSLQVALQALQAVDLTAREQAYWALRCTLVSRAEDLKLFDAVFAAFWGTLDPENMEEDTSSEETPPGVEEEDKSGQDGPALEGPERSEEQAPQQERDEHEDDEQEQAGQAYASVERLRQLDFAHYTDEELQQMAWLLERIPAIAPVRRSRRLRPARDGDTLDKRRTLRIAMRTEGYPLQRQYRRWREVPRRVVFVVDISGSMRPYARAMLMFLHAAVRAGNQVEAFTFGTRLTRVTRQLRERRPDRALEAAAHTVLDWAGGTRIGDSLKALNDTWGKRGLTRGAVVVIVSDGWERGNVELLSAEMERLHRAAHKVVWVNPLAGEPEYEPLVQGMAAALVYIDTFLPGHNLAALETLAEVLQSLPARRHQRSAGTSRVEQQAHSQPWT